MELLASSQLDGFLHRIRHGREGRLEGVEVVMATGRVKAVTFALAVPDSERDRSTTRLRLQVSNVSELRVQVRPTEDPTALADGLRVAIYQGLYFLDLQPWTDDPTGAHDFRASICYAAGLDLRWEMIP